MQMNPYQTPQMNSFIPQYGTYQQYNALQNVPRYQLQPEIQQGIYGKIVQSVDSIMANDVPMNGSVAFFPKSDLSEIYAKQWGADGKISTMVFKPGNSDTVNNCTDDAEKLKIGLSDEARITIKEYVDTLIFKIEELESKIDKSSTKTSSRNKISQDLDKV